VALRGDGTVWAWGNNEWHQLGHNRHTSDSQCPEPSECEGLPQAAAVAAGAESTLVVGSDGTVWIAGEAYNVTWMGLVIANGFLPVEGLPEASFGAAGYGFGLAIAKDGGVWSWSPLMCLHGELGRTDDADVGQVAVP